MTRGYCITGALIYDGSGGPALPAPLTVRDGRIERIGGAPSPGDEVVDAVGLALAPGFIDEHTHSDVSLLSEPGCLSHLGQGVTTQAVGLCGMSASPVTPAIAATIGREESVFGFPGVAWNWTGTSEYLAAIEKAQPATNVVALVGHGSLRRAVMGADDRAPTHEEQRRMEALLDRCLEEGAAGLSSGLTYPPGCFADIDELAGLATVAARRSKPYVTHLRAQGATILAAIDEAVAVAERSGVRLTISHLYPAYRQHWGQAPALLEAVELARARRVDVTYDITVFRRGGGALIQSLPGWALDGGHQALQARLREPGPRARIEAALQGGNLPPGYPPLEWDDCLVVKINSPSLAAVLQRTIGEVARERQQHPVATACDLLLDDPQLMIAPTIKSQPDLDAMLHHPLGVPVSDGFACHPVVHRALGLMPKSFGTFPHVLGDYVRTRRVLTLEDAIARMTRLPAERLGLRDRGRLRPGFAADLVLFDPSAVANRADEEDPSRAPTGIAAVMVNGRWAMVDGCVTGVRAGRTLSR